MKTLYVATHEGALATLPQNVAAMDWKPWLNCKDHEETLGLVSHRFLRNRGGVRSGECVSFVVLIRDRLDNTPEGRCVKAYEMFADKHTWKN